MSMFRKVIYAGYVFTAVAFALAVVLERYDTAMAYGMAASAYLLVLMENKLSRYQSEVLKEQDDAIKFLKFRLKQVEEKPDEQPSQSQSSAETHADQVQNP